MSSTIFERIEEWRTHLLDTSKRNRLVNFKSGRTGGIQLVRPDAGSLWRRLVVDEAGSTFAWKRELIDLPPDEIDADPGPADGGPVADVATPGHEIRRDILGLCLASPRLHPDELLTTLTDKLLNARLTRLALNAREAETELGVHTLFAAFGLLRWFESDDSREPVLSPLLLVPVRLDRETIESPWVLRPEEEEVQRNDTLAMLMQADHRVVLPTIEELGVDPDDQAELFGRYATAVAERIRHHPRWGVESDAVALGIFQFQKLAMWQDLEANADRIAAHAICRGIAGDREAIPAPPAGLPRAEELDERVPPGEAVHILDADSSQQAALEAVKRGANLVLDGPPGTGKSQTIANLIGEFLAAGRTVLFVSEKTVALEVVKQRLDGCGLGDFCLELHSHRANKRGVIDEVGRCLSLEARCYRDPAESMRQLAEARCRLNAYVRALHARREPLGKSAFDVHGELARADGPRSTTRCSPPDPLLVDGEALRRATDVLGRIPACLGVIRGRDRHPWRRCRATVYSLVLLVDVEFHLGRLAQLAPEAAAIGAELGRPAVADWGSAAADARRLLDGPLVPAAWFEGDPRAVAGAVIEFARVAAGIREAQGRLPEFAPAALREIGRSAMDGLDAVPGPEEVGLIGLTRLGVREAAGRLGEAEGLAREATERCRQAATVADELWAALGVGIAGFGLHQLPALARVGRLVLRAGAVADCWWDEAVRGELLAVATRAAESAGRAARLRQELVPVFAPATLDVPAAPPFSNLTMGPDRITEDDAPMGALRDRLTRRRAALANLAEAAAAVARCSATLMHLLGSPTTPRLVAQARDLAERVGRAITLAPIAASLWDADRREKARAALVEAERVRATAESAARALEGRVTPETLAGGLDSDVTAALRHRSWFRRLSPGWWIVRRRLRPAFPAGLPPTDRLFADLGELVDRRRAVERVDWLAASYRDCWAFGPDGRPDPGGSEAAFGRASEAERLHPPTDRFRALMAGSDPPLRVEVESAVEALRRSISDLEEARGRLAELPTPPGQSPPQAEGIELDALRRSAEEQATADGRRLAAMDAGRAAMAPGVFDAATSTELVGWVARLSEYAEREAYLREIERRYGERLGIVPSNGGPADLVGVTDRLKCVDALARTFGGKVPESLRATLAPGGTLDRARVERGLAALGSRVDDLKSSWQRLGEACDLRDWADPETGLPRGPYTVLAGRLVDLADAVGRAGLLARRVEPLLHELAELAWADLPDRVATLRELVGLRARLDALLGPARIDLGPEEAEARDWAGPARLAEALLGFLDAWSRPIGPALARGLSDESTRAELGALVERTEAARAGGFDESWAYLTTELFDPTEDISTGIIPDAAPLDALAPWLAERARDVPALQDWIRFRELERDAAAAGVGAALDEVRRGEVRADEAAAAYRVRFLRRWLDAVYDRTPELRQFETDAHEHLAARFAELDRGAVRDAPDRIRNLQLTRPERSSLLADPEALPRFSELGLLYNQIERKRGHLPLRKLFARIPTVLTRLKPCLMMSPLAVSTYLQSPELVFDLVIFDEASQVRPHDAIAAIFRGRQLVVAGDRKQLPPTSFFERSADGDDAAEDTEDLGDFESVLDVCRQWLPRRGLRWHYRSRREGLIAFSNRCFYDGELVTFPSPEDAAGAAVRLEYVPEGRFHDGVNPVEARRIAAMVIDHVRTDPGMSLGVIAFSQRQQLRILDELEALRRTHPELEDHFREGRGEPFFVKNLENVQGDERDAIILGVGYGPDDAGKVAMRFGPLNLQGGERRLNVAVTRAKYRMTVVSSIRAADIDLSRTGAEGVRLLRTYLDFAESGSVALDRAVTEADGRGYDSPFEREVAEELRRRGLTVHTQVGCGGYRIDLAVVDPERPGRYLLGVECDGATYHSSATARDRDRLRQEVLEQNLGWHLCRVWSTDWLRDREGQVRRVLDAVERARREQSVASVVPPRPPDPPRPTPTAARPAKPKVWSPAYKNIAEVPELEIRRLIEEVLAQAGGTELKDLTRAVARRLGFERMGKNIEKRIGDVLDEMIRGGRLSASEEGYVRMVPVRA